MKKATSRIIALFMAILLTTGFTNSVTYAAGETDEAVAAVISQLEAIDTLQEMQNKRSEYKVKNNHYDTGTTNSAIAEEHEKVRAEYEAYVSMMFAARIAAQQAYDDLSDTQKAQIDPALTAKLSNDLSTDFKGGTFEVTPGDDEYTFEAVIGGAGQGYEVSNHMVSGEIPQTFILIDTSDGKTTWTPNGQYVCGESNYEVTYCCDVQTMLNAGTDYKRVNLEDSNYYGKEASRHIRAILQSSYPYVTMDEMKANLKAGGMDAQFVDSLTRADMISAVQMAVWTYANANDGAAGGLGYFATVDVPKNTGIYFTPLHDYTNECWDWLPGKRQRSYDARAEYRVNNLAYYLCSLEGVDPAEDQIVISDIKVTRAELLKDSDGMYDVGMYVYLNNSGNVQDKLNVIVTSYTTNEDGSITETDSTRWPVEGQSRIDALVKANAGDTIKVVVEGVQTLGKGVYFYEPKGGRDASQSLVGVGEGPTHVRTEETFEFEENVAEMGLRIYKTVTGTGLPLSDITFSVYNTTPGEGEVLSEIPTKDEIAKYATEENKVGSITTDVTGYAELALEKGTYLVVEEHNKDKVEAPVDPFYISVPMDEVKSNADGSTSVKTINVVSIYPKNKPVVPSEEPPVVPPTPNEVTGQFSILKHKKDAEEITLSGAQFAVYRAATETDENTEILSCNGVQYAAVPVIVDGSNLILTTGKDGSAVSPELICGTYFVKEIKAPTGYILLDEAISVTVVPKTMTVGTQVKIANQKGFLLPETGGTGIALFWVIGSMMMIGAGVVLVSKKRITE